jgi:hypothetical protein
MTAMGRERASHELRAALRVIRWTIESFGNTDAARFFASAAAEPNILDPLVLASIDAAGAIVASASTAMGDLAAKLGALGRGNSVDRAIGAGMAPLDRPPRLPATPPDAPSAEPASGRLTPSANYAARATPGRGEPTVTRRTPLTPTGAELHQFLQSGIAGFDQLDQSPLAPPAPLDDATLVPIDDLLYRGRAALQRALEVRDIIRLSSGNTDEALAELFDLLDLAAAE